MPVYDRYGVAYLWLVNPEAFALRDGLWTVMGLLQEDNIVQVAPFEALALNLADLWTETEEVCHRFKRWHTSKTLTQPSPKGRGL